MRRRKSQGGPSAALREGPWLVLPRVDFRLVRKRGQQEPPHRKRIVAELRRGPLLFRLAANWPRSAFWAWATDGAWRASATIRTASRQKAEAWAAAFEAGRVRVARPEEEEEPPS